MTDQNQDTPQSKRRFASPGIKLLITGVSIYFVAPTVLEAFSSWDQLSAVNPGWLVMVGAFQLVAFLMVCALQRLALRTRRWFPVVTSLLAAYAAGRALPGGGATGVAVQFQMLRSAGVGTARASSGLTAAGLLQLGTTFALPLVALPAIIFGAPVPRDLLSGVWLGVALFVVLLIIVAAGILHDGLLTWAGNLVDRAKSVIPRLSSPESPTRTQLLTERDALLSAFDEKWLRAAGLTVGRAAFEYLSLLTAVAAFGVDARPSLVLLAYTSSALLALIPITPGGLGFVEAGLTGTLTLAGVPAAEAVSVALLYRLFSFWLPIPIGLLAAVVFRFVNDRPTTAPESHAS